MPLLKGTICAFIKRDHLCPARKGLSVPNFKGLSVPEKVELLYLCFAGMAHVYMSCLNYSVVFTGTI